ncbi:hypothetical protein TD95_005264 [Thielaviopsis punctulata]|uniref:Uncharacterized protein n=1 Tax=Thielaviopsis punctulata TaxID=72032 RepID=A0A0F4ZCB6_9PEZI|nr:hypothetical protein TD95_005264 [Thielaviopsis punctulata]
MHAASPLVKLLGLTLLCSSQALAASAAIGVDLGTEYIKASLVKPGIPLEIVLTKDSRRKEASSIAFKPARDGPKEGEFPERVYGSDAVALAARFPGEVYPNLKALLGKRLDSDVTQEYIKRHPALAVSEKSPRGTVAFGSKAFLASEDTWMVEELLAMQLQSIRKNAQALAGSDSPISAAVITVPPFYTTEEKRAVHLAAKLAGLEVLDLISDGLAVGLNYATSRQFPSVTDGQKPEYHLVFDMGAGSAKATVLRFQSRSVKDVGKYNKTVQEVQVMGYGWDRSLGGDALNSLIIDDMAAKFAESPKAQAASATADKVLGHGRAVARLTKEAERLRHILSANANTQGSFEGLYDDIDFKYKITRADFEEMASSYIDRVGATIKAALIKANLDVSDLDSVILHGGASRTPFVQRELEKVIGSADKIRSSVNSDESAVMGAVFRGAEISPSFRVKEIRLAETTPYSSGIKWVTPEGKLRHQRVWSPVSVLGAPAKEVPLPVRTDFEGTFYQAVDENEVDLLTLKTTNLTESVAELKEKFMCADSGIRFKFAATLAREDGEIVVSKTFVECETEVESSEGLIDGVKNLFGFGKKDQKPLKDSEAEVEAETEEASSSLSSSSSSSSSSATAASSSSTASEAAPSASAASEKKKTVVSIPVGFTVSEAGIPSLTKDEFKAATGRLKAFEASDLARRQREEALNQLEGFTYKARELPETEQWQTYATEAERTEVLKKATEYGDWVYGDGAEAAKKEFEEKLKDLKSVVDRVVQRIAENEERPGLVEKLQKAITEAVEYTAKIRSDIEKYEEWHASASASSSGSSTAEAPSETNDFDGLEDEAEPSKKPSMDDVLKERGPVPPMYEVGDLSALDAISSEAREWLDSLLPQQEPLGPTDDAVLKTADIKRYIKKLEQAGVELTMKGVRNFEKRQSAEARKEKAAKDKARKDKKDKAKKEKEDKKHKKEAEQEEEEEGQEADIGGKIEEIVKKAQEAGAKVVEEAEAKAESEAKADEHDEL